MIQLARIKQLFSFIFYKFLDIIGWSKIIIQGLSGLYGTLSAIDLTKVLSGEHPAEVFFHWALCCHPLRIFLFTQAILLFIAIAEKFAIGSYTKLKQELKEKEEKLEILNNNIKELFEGLLMAFANAELYFVDQTVNDERISLYLAKKDSDNNINYLYPIARYSNNPDYRSIRRRRYSVSKGCIGKAYQNDYCYDGNVTIEDCINKYAYTEEEYKAMRMKPSTVAAVALKDKSNRVVGVLVAESKDKSWLAGNIEKKLKKQAKYYANICVTLKDYIYDKYNYETSKKGDMPW